MSAQHFEAKLESRNEASHKTETKFKDRIKLTLI